MRPIIPPSEFEAAGDITFSTKRALKVFLLLYAALSIAVGALSILFILLGSGNVETFNFFVSVMKLQSLIFVIPVSTLLIVICVKFAIEEFVQ